jgi:hypothetical protein
MLEIAILLSERISGLRAWCRLSIAITTLLLVVGAAFFWLGRWFCATQPDYREVEAAGARDAEQEPEAPLLQNGRDHSVHM